MKLIFDEYEFKKLLSNLKIEKTISGDQLQIQLWVCRNREIKLVL